MPLWTWTSFGALFACRYLPFSPPGLGGLRLGVCLVLVLFALFAPGMLAVVVPPAADSSS